MLLRHLFLAVAGIAAIAITTAGTLGLLFPQHQAANQAPLPAEASQPVKSTSVTYETAPPPKKPVIIIHHRHYHPKPKYTRKIIRVTPSTIPATASTTPVVTPTPTPTETPTPVVSETLQKLNLYGAAKAVAFAIAQIGCPYVYGGTGPCSSGFDCSGLVYAAWQYAGTDIPRTSYGQWSGLRHVSLPDIQPGDIVVSNGAGHVGIYVGDGYLIDALNQGTPVERISIHTPWYASSIIGAVRP